MKCTVSPDAAARTYALSRFFKALMSTLCMNCNVATGGYSVNDRSWPNGRGAAIAALAMAVGSVLARANRADARCARKYEKTEQDQPDQQDHVCKVGASDSIAKKAESPCR